MSDAFVVRTPTRRVDVTGSDRLDYLEDVTTQALKGADAGTVTSSLYLDPHGAPLAMFDVAVLAEKVALLTPDEAVATTLVEVLGGRTFLSQATFELTDDVVIVLRGEGAEEVAKHANLSTRPGTVRPAGDAFVIGRDDGALDIVGPAELIEDIHGLLTDAGAREGSDEDLEAWRIAAGVPGWGTEVTPPHLPEELGLLPSHVHLAKGCYPGQEAIARMWMLGRPRRRLAVVTPTAGTIDLGWQAGSGRQQVTVTSMSPVGDVALAFVPGDAAEGSSFADEDGNSIEVARVIGADPHPPGADPAVTRRRDKART